MNAGVKGILSRSSLFLVCGLVLVPLLLEGCGDRRKVAIPYDWQSPPPPSAEVQSQGQGVAPAAAPGASQGTGPILKPTPSFREGNLPSGPENKSPVQTPASAPAPAKKQEPQAPQQLASMHLVDQGKTALSQGKPDAAIPLLEQAIQIDAYNGEAFFGLARAWRMKGSRNKAQEFSQKAEVLLQEKPTKLKEVYLFEADLFKELGDSKKAELYKQKASKL
jgi:hypothetical protein